MSPPASPERRSASTPYGDSERLDVAKAASYLGTSERHIRRLVEERRIPFIKLGDGRSARLRFDAAQLDQWLDAHSHQPETDR